MRGGIRRPVGRGMFARMSPTITSCSPTNHSGGAIIAARDCGSSHVRLTREATTGSNRNADATLTSSTACTTGAIAREQRPPQQRLQQAADGEDGEEPERRRPA